MIKLPTRGRVYSQFFGGWITIDRVVNDYRWYFRFNGKVMRAQTPLSWFIKQHLYQEE